MCMFWGLGGTRACVHMCVCFLQHTCARVSGCSCKQTEPETVWQTDTDRQSKEETERKRGRGERVKTEVRAGGRQFMQRSNLILR